MSGAPSAPIRPGPEQAHCLLECARRRYPPLWRAFFAKTNALHPRRDEARARICSSEASAPSDWRIQGKSCNKVRGLSGRIDLDTMRAEQGEHV